MVGFHEVGSEDGLAGRGTDKAYTEISDWGIRREFAVVACWTMLLRCLIIGAGSLHHFSRIELRERPQFSLPR